MPNGFIPDEGLDVPVMRIVNPAGANQNAWRLVFWVNPIIPDHTIKLAGLVQATWPGYTFVTLNPATWKAPTVAPQCATTQYGTVALSWNVTGPTTQTNYGYALIDPAAGVIRWIQRFEDADIKPLASGDQVTLLPQYTLTSAACPTGLVLKLRQRNRTKGSNARRYNPPVGSGEEDRG